MKKFFFVVLAMVMLGSVQAQTAFKQGRRVNRDRILFRSEVRV